MKLGRLPGDYFRETSRQENFRENFVRKTSLGKTSQIWYDMTYAGGTGKLVDPVMMVAEMIKRMAGAYDKKRQYG